MKRDANALAAMAVIFLIVSLVGFTPRCFGPLAGGAYAPPSIWMHTHAIASLAFLLVFAIQPALIAARKIALLTT